MYPVVGKCPVCGEEMAVTRLHCPGCDSALEGQFALGRFYRLSADQLAFLETFVRLEGKITWVAEEMGLSYPTVRSRLVEVIRALGYEVREEPPQEVRQRAATQRQAVLDDLAAGKVSVDEALRLLQAL
jgi:hypothetical protein